MEDMCQLTERLKEDKYQGSYEQIAKAIAKYSAYPGLDLVNFFEQVLFSFITGNADMNLKNFSMLHLPVPNRCLLFMAVLDEIMFIVSICLSHKALHSVAVVGELHRSFRSGDSYFNWEIICIWLSHKKQTNRTSMYYFPLSEKCIQYFPAL